MNGSGCIFEHYGKIPESVYKIDVYRSPLEEAVFKNDVTAFKQLVQVCRTNCHQCVRFCNACNMDLHRLCLLLILDHFIP